MTKCRICHRNLKREPWCSLGIGKVCSTKTNTQRELDFETGDDHVPYDGGNIFIERVSAPTLTQPFGILTQQKHPASGIRTNVPRIEVKHSPTGFNFGYGGSGPADFALNVMLMFCADRKEAHLIYQDFKFKFVASTNADNANRLEIPKADIIGFIEGSMAIVNPKMRLV